MVKTREKRQAELEMARAVLQLIHKIAYVPNLEQALQEFTTTLQTIFHAPLVGIWTARNGELAPIAVAGPKAAHAGLIPVYANPGGANGCSPACLAFLEQRSQLIDFTHDGCKLQPWEEFVRQEHLQRGLYIPLSYLNEAMGVLIIYVRKLHTVAPYLTTWLEPLASIVTAIIRDRQHQQLVLKQRNDLTLLLSAAAILAKVESERSLFLEAGEMALGILQIEAGFVSLRRPGGWQVAHAFGMLVGHEDRLQQALDNMLEKHAQMREGAARGQHLDGLFPRIAGFDSIPEEFKPLWRELGFQSSATYPLRVQDEVVDIMSFRSSQEDFFSENTEILKAFTDQISMALEAMRGRQILYENAVTDLLTGILNRRGFEEEFEKKVAQVQRMNETMLFLILDLDYFKILNDTQGHQAGDRALRVIARSLQDAVRPYDVVARLGGDEFVVLLVNASCSPALRQRILKIVDSLPLADFNLGVSVGVACYPLDAKDYQGLYRIADQRLYQAKQQGRHQVVGI